MRFHANSILICLILTTACRTSQAPAAVPVPAPKTPATMSTAWIPADTKTLCSDVALPQLCSTLLELRDRDQLIRRKWLEDRENAAIKAEVERVDRENLAAVEAIIAEHGYPGKSLVGVKASGASWTIIQHADLETQKKYLDVMTRAVESGELEGALLATTVDRIRIREGQPQWYGTQFREVNGEMVPEPIEDEAHVDERRASVGLQPLAEYAILIKQMYQSQAKKP